jgi:hypothetical protein
LNTTSAAKGVLGQFIIPVIMQFKPGLLWNKKMNGTAGNSYSEAPAEAVREPAIYLL